MGGFRSQTKRRLLNLIHSATGFQNMPESQTGYVSAFDSWLRWKRNVASVWPIFSYNQEGTWTELHRWSRRAFKTLPEVPVRTLKCIPFKEVPEVYHSFMHILHCFISPKASLPIRGVSRASISSVAIAVVTWTSSKDSGLQEDGVLIWAPLSFFCAHLPSFFIVIES